MKNLSSTINFLEDSKTFKVAGKKKINLTENGELIETVTETAEILNNFFCKHSTTISPYKIFK